MKTLGKLVGFVNTTKPEEARTFYGEKLGFRFTGDDGYALTFDANGTMIRVSKAQAFTPAQGTVMGWEVDDIRATVAELEANGVTCEQFNLPFLQQDASGIWAAPDGDQVAWFKDPDGNMLSVSQHVH